MCISLVFFYSLFVMEISQAQSDILLEVQSNNIYVQIKLDDIRELPQLLDYDMFETNNFKFADKFYLGVMYGCFFSYVFYVYIADLMYFIY